MVGLGFLTGDHYSLRRTEFPPTEMLSLERATESQPSLSVDVARYGEPRIPPGATESSAKAVSPDDPWSSVPVARPLDAKRFGECFR